MVRRVIMNMGQKAKGNSVLDSVPVWSCWLLGAISGLIAGHVIGVERAALRVSTQQPRTAAIAVALCLILVFVFASRRFPGFANVALWVAAFCVGLIRC